MHRATALLAAERDRVRLLEAQLSEASEAHAALAGKAESLDEKWRAAVSKAADAERARALADGQLRTSQGSRKVLEAQLAEAAAEVETSRAAMQQLEAERGSAAGAASKEAASLSAALRAARARCALSLQRCSAAMLCAGGAL